MVFNNLGNKGVNGINFFWIHDLKFLECEIFYVEFKILEHKNNTVTIKTINIKTHSTKNAYISFCKLAKHHNM